MKYEPGVLERRQARRTHFFLQVRGALQVPECASSSSSRGGSHRVEHTSRMCTCASALRASFFSPPITTTSTTIPPPHPGRVSDCSCMFYSVLKEPWSLLSTAFPPPQLSDQVTQLTNFCLQVLDVLRDLRTNQAQPCIHTNTVQLMILLCGHTDWG